MSYSPLFSTVNDNFGHVIRVCYKETPTLPYPFHHLTLRNEEPESFSPFDLARAYSGEVRCLNGRPGAKLGISLVKITSENCPEVKSIEAAENTVFDICEKADTIYVPDQLIHLTTIITRSASLIASRTRRGAGNKVFMHPDIVANYLMTKPISLSVSAPIEIGLWTLAGKLNGCMDVYTNPDMQRDRVYVVYSTDTNVGPDGPAQLIAHEGKTYLYLLPEEKTSLGWARDYILRIDITPAS